MADIKVEGTKAPPKKITSIGPPTPPNDKRKDRVEGVNGIFQLAGLGFIMTGQFADAGAVSLHGPAISNEVVNLAEGDDRIAAVVDKLLQVGPYAGLVAAVMPLVLQILANHKIVPADKLGAAGVKLPETLESEVKTAMELQALEALRQQMAMEEELAEQRANFEAAQASRNGESPE
jgi:hypothetical protein